MAAKFRLESVLSLKNNIEKVKKKELADAYAHKEKLDAQKEILKQEQRELSDELVKCLSGKIDPATIDNLNNYKVDLFNKITAIDQDIEKASETILEKQNNLVEAMKSRKILENLKEIHKLEQQELMREEEQKLIDEIVSYRYIKQESGE
ncbi:MAG: flagellar export protein FliJ [Epulopiscium sp. Nele67-Bin004]|nr:MAG: flagellar export protein FliJ [Epulopiscium sp. Nele67-Bin004]